MSGFKKNSNISIALCTYNGAAYLEEQLQSIAAQSLVPAEVVIGDDNSDDGTVAIAEQFKANAGFPVSILKNSARLGFVKNFARTIEHCVNDYIALCDQDDLWLPERLALSYTAMKEAEAEEGREKAMLVHSDLLVGNAEGRVIAPSFRKKNRLNYATADPLKNLLVQNFVTGSTVLINRALAREALPFPAEARLHDWWLALVAAARGRIISIAKATVIYRQHDLNVIGSKNYYLLQSLQRVINMADLEKDIAATFNQAYALSKRLEELPGYRGPEYMEQFLLSVRQSGGKAALCALRQGIVKRPVLANLIFLLFLCKGGYLGNLGEWAV